MRRKGRPARKEEIRVTAQDLEDMAKLAGYDKPDQLQIAEKIKGMPDVEVAFVAYVTGISFLLDHPQEGYDSVTIMRENISGELEALAAAALIHCARANEPSERVEVFVKNLFKA